MLIPQDIPALLRDIAQNDYMIDQYFLPTGEDLNEAAKLVEALLEYKFMYESVSK